MTPDAQRALTARSTLDLAGATSAVLCAVHCVATGAFVAVLPVFGVGALLDESIEQAFLAAAVVFGVLSVGIGLRAHGRRTPALLLIAGLALLLGVRPRMSGGSLAEIMLVVAGSLLLVGAHRQNLRASRAVTGSLQSIACGVQPPHNRPGDTISNILRNKVL